MKRLLKWGIAGLISLILLFPFILIFIGNQLLHDRDIPEKDLLISNQASKTVLAFFPHPDDEITVAGTLISLIEAGYQVHLVCLTKGEAADTEGKLTREELGAIREKEMQDAVSSLGIQHLHHLDYPDSGLEDLGLDSLKRIALNWITQIEPDILLSYDSKVGLYGHSDHRLSGLAMEEVFLENKGQGDFSPTQLFQVTLSPKQIQFALKVSSGFQRNYPRDPKKGLPTPDFSIDTHLYFHQVLDAMHAHQSQQKVFQDLMPYHDQIPTWIYSRVFGREYFHEVK
ncbi:PIG-L deacetylase family protein [Algoriphagus limi]|uniref:PIG-L family deacetylase n=1 Tax=Algoriphagus limi TaxID=2975273 RepID=A0ABT2G2N5_9BACT|nr:PIG-L family deacetylase [Algoriphagus limi]MCS5489521.1 PIG-L family deacetylase [Algoriphagus limi]